LVRTLDDLYDMGFGGAALFTVDAHHHLIAVHHPAHFAPIEINVVESFVFGKQKAKPVGMGMNTAAHQVLSIRQGVVILLQARQSANAAKVAQRIDNRLKVVAAKTAAALDLRRRQPLARFVGEQIENF
jgi:hypothetical protein